MPTLGVIAREIATADHPAAIAPIASTSHREPTSARSERVTSSDAQHETTATSRAVLPIIVHHFKL